MMVVARHDDAANAQPQRKRRRVPPPPYCPEAPREVPMLIMAELIHHQIQVDAADADHDQLKRLRKLNWVDVRYILRQNERLQLSRLEEHRPLTLNANGQRMLTVSAREATRSVDVWTNDHFRKRVFLKRRRSTRA